MLLRARVRESNVGVEVGFMWVVGVGDDVLETQLCNPLSIMIRL